MARQVDDPHPHDADEDVDGCLCDVEINPIEMIADTDLPAAAGGVRLTEAPPGDDGEDVCGFEVTDATADEHLPAAVGGVS
jgi:hypothetical protein